MVSIASKRMDRDPVVASPATFRYCIHSPNADGIFGHRKFNDYCPTSADYLRSS